MRCTCVLTLHAHVLHTAANERIPPHVKGHIVLLHVINDLQTSAGGSSCWKQRDFVLFFLYLVHFLSHFFFHLRMRTDVSVTYFFKKHNNICMTNNPQPKAYERAASMSQVVHYLFSTIFCSSQLGLSGLFTGYKLRESKFSVTLQSLNSFVKILH